MCVNLLATFRQLLYSVKLFFLDYNLFNSHNGSTESHDE